VRFEVDPSGDDLEEQQLIQLSRLEMQRAMFSGQFKVLSWATAIAMALSIDENTKRWDANG
jgi:hypothetical protein